MKNRTWAEVNLDNLVFNYKSFKDYVGEGKKLMAVIKANAYGHDAVNVAKALETTNCDYFGVACLDEALELRQNGIKPQILVLTAISDLRVKDAVDNDITLTVYDYTLAKAVSDYASEIDKVAKIHIKLDTGMTRVGLDVNIAKEQIEKIKLLNNIEIEGVFTHFSSADDEIDVPTRLQFDKYLDVVNSLSFEVPIKHVCNSAGTIMFPDMHLDMARVGISFYGSMPSKYVDATRVRLKTAMTLKSEIIRINELTEDSGIGYGLTHKAKKGSIIATIPIGYADGLLRQLSNRGYVEVNGQLAPIVGRICMDQTMIDVTEIEGDIRLGQEVIIFGSEELSVDKVARLAGTISYEIYCAPQRRVTRNFTLQGEEFTRNYLLD